MTEYDKNFVRDWKEKYINTAEQVLDVGSRDINGNVRDIFKDSEVFIGIDYIAGIGVDYVMRGDEILSRFSANTFDLVLCLNTLEHDDNFLGTLSQMEDVLKPGGYLIISTPTFGFPIHRHPKDYWRFGEDAYREILFKRFELLELKEFLTKPDENGGCNPAIIAIGKKYED